MSNYTENPKMVRVDFWKPSGKWYATEAVEWVEYTGDHLIREVFHESLRRHFGDKPRLTGLRATCLEPYHEHGHPISLLVPETYPEF